MDWELHTVIGSVQDTDSLYKHKDEGGVDQVTLQYLRAFEFDDLLPPFLSKSHDNRFSIKNFRSRR